MKAGKHILIICALALALPACGGGSSSPAPVSTAQIPAPGGAGGVSSKRISGTITYDHIPHDRVSSGLDYANMTARPARGIIVQLVERDGTVLAATVSDETGAYEFTTQAETDVQIRALAHLQNTGAAQWDFKVTDNTQDNALYALSGSLSAIGNGDQIRDLHAASGWTGNAYAETRAAAPFAILSPVYEAVTAFAAIDGSVSFPPLELRWSVNNRSAIGARESGDIGTSAYFPDGDSGSIYLLGDAGSDTDEYDPHVILHEWGHYFEHQLSRTDSIGGAHGLRDRLDARVAYGEGWGNALAAMITGDPVYRDSSGTGQGFGFSFDLEKNNHTNAGWFNEGSVGSILYDLYDDTADGADMIELGLGPIYQAMTSDDFKASVLFTTIFVFADSLRNLDQMNQGAINDLLAGQSISGLGPSGEGEINSGAINSSLPIFQTAVTGAAPVEICSVNDAGRYNKLGNREFIYLDIAQAGDYTVSMIRRSGDKDRDPDFNIWQRDQLIMEAVSSVKDRETLQLSLAAGTYVIDAFDFKNINGNSSNTGDACYDFSVSQ